MARLIATACLLGLALAGTARAQDDDASQAQAPAANDAPAADETPAADGLPPGGEAGADGGARAQSEAAGDGGSPDPDLTLPPRLDPSPADARLEPAPEEREDMLEAVVTGGQTDFRLPDLGTSFREEEEVDPNDRIDVTFLYLYDPDNIDPAEEVFPTIEDLRRVGFLRVFELRFGRRSRE